MQNEGYVIEDVVTGGSHPFRERPIPATSRLAESSDIHRRLQDLAPRAAELRRQELVRDWADEKYAQAARGESELLRELADYGMA